MTTNRLRKHVTSTASAKARSIAFLHCIGLWFLQTKYLILISWYECASTEVYTFLITNLAAAKFLLSLYRTKLDLIHSCTRWIQDILRLYYVPSTVYYVDDSCFKTSFNGQFKAKTFLKLVATTRL